MKNKLMLLVILAGLLTATYRFLPADLQRKVDVQIAKVLQLKTLLPTATANPPQKKYVLNVSDAAPLRESESGTQNVASAYMQHRQNEQVRDEGEVVKILFDDTSGSKHQQFIVRTADGLTVLIAHNIDLARRINGLAVGDTVAFSGEYVWNEKGGVVHWTHRDPRNKHVEGWIKHKGVIYQ